MSENITMTDDDIGWLVECMERMADYDQQSAESAENEARSADERDLDDAGEYANRAKWMREDADRTRRVYDLLRSATGIRITK
jgi:hypothetical protein